MKSFQQFLSESIAVNGDFNENLYENSSKSEQTQESFFADVVWEGKLYRLEIEGSMISRNELTEEIQGDYPGAIVHQIYPGNVNTSRIKKVQRYQPERLSWSD